MSRKTDEIKYRVKYVEFSYHPRGVDSTSFNKEACLDEVRSICREHQICADLYSLSKGRFVGSVLESGIVYTNLSEIVGVNHTVGE